MFAVYTWSGQKLGTQHDATLLLYSELGGRFLGKLVVPKRFEGLDIFGVLQDLQVQAHKLMRHEWRPASEVVLKVGGKLLLPCGFGYKQHLELIESQEAVSSLHDALANKKPMFMTYDDNDEYVRQVLEQHDIDFAYVDAHDKLVLNLLSRGASFTGEASKLCEVFSPRQVTLEVAWHFVDDVALDLLFLSNTNVKHLKLDKITPKSWFALSKLTSLTLNVEHIPEGISELVGLKSLRISYSNGLPSDFTLLKISELRVKRCLASDVLGLLSVLQTSYDNTKTSIMNSLTTLDLSCNYMCGTHIPRTLGTLVGLKDLRLHANNFSGSIPTNLGCLTNLSRLYIHDGDGLQLALPTQVTDLEKSGTVLDIGRCV